MMKKTIGLLALCLVCTLLNAQKMTVASYNIRLDVTSDSIAGNGWQQRVPYICDLVIFNDFDIFGAQEVIHHQLQDMLSLLPGYGYIGVGRDDGATKGEYSPVFYKKDKFELLDSGTFWLSDTTDVPNVGWDAALPRVCSWGEFRAKDGLQFWFFNLHMDHIGVEARRESAKLVLSWIEEKCGKDPVILTGDFNVDQDNESYRLLHDSDTFDDSYELADIKMTWNGTFNSFNTNAMSDRRIDHIFLSPQFKVDRYGILTGTYRMPLPPADIAPESEPQENNRRRRDTHIARTPSDHYPVMVKITY